MVLAAFLALALGLTLAGAARAADAETDAMLAKLGRPGDFSLAPPEVSEDAPSGWYLRADGGYAAASAGGFSVAGVPLKLDASHSTSGWSVGAGVGYRLTSFLRAEASVDYLSLGSARLAFADFNASATVALASLYWDVATFSGITPYLSAGAGFAIDTVDVPAALGSAGNAWEFAWSVGAGVSYALNTSISFDLGYRYVSLGSPSYAGGLAVGDAAAHQLRIGIRTMLK